MSALDLVLEYRLDKLREVSRLARASGMEDNLVENLL
jgi:hypothetical protein